MSDFFIKVLYYIFIHPGLYMFDSFEGRTPSGLVFALVCWWIGMLIIAVLLFRALVHEGLFLA